MGIVSGHLRDVLAAQVRDHGLVVWFDPDQHYRAFASALTLPDTTIAIYEDTFFGLRYQVDPLLRGERSPRLVVYVGLAEEETDNALVELTASGVVLAPGQIPPERNTRLSAVARTALLGHPETWTVESANEIAQQIDAGQIGSLDEADRVAEKGAESAGVIPLIFGTGNPHEVALQVVGSDDHDKDIVAKGAVAAVTGLLGTVYGCELPDTGPLPDIRKTLAHHVLRTDVVACIGGALPARLQSLKVAPVGPPRDACVALARAWRDRYNLRESYADSADRVQSELALSGADMTIDGLRACETVAGFEAVLQEAIEDAAVTAETQALDERAAGWRALIERRLGNFWSAWPDRYPEAQARWLLLQTALDLLVMADSIEASLKHVDGGPAAFLERYTGQGAGQDTPWCLLDTHQRHLERRYHDFTFEERHASLERLLARARQRYMEVGGTLAERFAQALKASKFVVPGIQRQRDIYATAVAPALKAGKTAYLLVDALRFEMARELSNSFQRDYDVVLSPAVGIVPTITDIGMAALMPGAERDATVVNVGGGKLALEIDATVLKDRASRLAWLKGQARARVAVATVDQMLPRPKKALDQELKDAELILITSQEIDALCEGDNIHLARKVMDDMLPELAKVVQKLRDYGCARIVVTADHGYLFGDELDTDMKIEPPGGRTDDLHRRVWVGSGGAASASYLRAPLKDFGLSDDLEIAVPWGFGAFIAAGGGRAYFHGGMAPQELAIPVLTLSPLSPMPTSTNTLEWTLLPGSRKISTRFFSTQVTGRIGGLFDVELPRVRVEVRAKKDVLSLPVAASYGFVEATGDVEPRLKDDDRQVIEANTVTLMITSTSAKGTVSVHLLDAATGRELVEPLKVDMDIAL